MRFNQPFPIALSVVMWLFSATPMVNLPDLTSLPVPAPSVDLRYSWVYDQTNYRERYSNCPSVPIVRAQIDRFEKLWARYQPKVLGQVRQVTGIATFPTQPIVVYGVGCGRGISDPLTLVLFERDSDGAYRPESDEDFLYTMRHELLHRVVLAAYQPEQERLFVSYPDEPPIVRNHISVAGFEVRLDGYASVLERYQGSENYSHALSLAREQGFTMNKLILASRSP